jgi:hypothetical protein
MKVKLSVRKKGATLYEGIHEITDAEHFGRAFADMWPSCRIVGCRRPPASAL